MWDTKRRHSSDRDEVTWVWAWGGSWERSMWHDCLRGHGKVQYELAVVLVEPDLSLRVGAAGGLAGVAVVEKPPARACMDFPGFGPVPGGAGGPRGGPLGGVGRGVGVARRRHCARAPRG